MRLESVMRFPYIIELHGASPLMKREFFSIPSSSDCSPGENGLLFGILISLEARNLKFMGLFDLAARIKSLPSHKVRKTKTKRILKVGPTSYEFPNLK